MPRSLTLFLPESRHLNSGAEYGCCSSGEESALCVYSATILLMTYVQDILQQLSDGREMLQKQNIPLIHSLRCVTVTVLF